MQHKKRVEGPPTSLSANLHETSGVKRREYALLGQQEKFAQNVQYLLKGPSSSDLSINLKENQNTNKRVDDKDVSPSKQMKIDAEKVCVCVSGICWLLTLFPAVEGRHCLLP